MVKNLDNFRTLCLVGFGSCTFLVALALYFQYVDKLEPCPLCIFQRIAFMGMGLGFLIGALHYPSGWGRKVYTGIISLTGLSGTAIAARHVWLQNLPEDQVPECGPGLEFMLQAFPFQKVLKTVLQGSGECAEMVWTFFGLSMPGWSLLWLIALTVPTFYLFLKK